MIIKETGLLDWSVGHASFQWYHRSEHPKTASHQTNQILIKISAGDCGFQLKYLNTHFYAEKAPMDSRQIYRAILSQHM